MIQVETKAKKESRIVLTSSSTASCLETYPRATYIILWFIYYKHNIIRVLISFHLLSVHAFSLHSVKPIKQTMIVIQY